MSDLVLSLFPGIGLLDMAFEEAGLCVVRGPDLLWGGDVKRFHPPAGRFDGVIGGPPCKAFSSLRHIIISRWGVDKLAENLIPEFERCVNEARPAWFLMENVPDAPEPVTPGYGVCSILLNNRWVGGEQNRVRRFSFGLEGATAVDLRKYVDYAALESSEWSYAVTGGVAMNRNPLPRAARLVESLRLQGLPADFFAHSPFIKEKQQEMIGNGVPLPMGRAIAMAVRRALEAMEAADAA